MKSVVFAGVFLLASLASASTATNWWQAVDGKYDGSWSDAAHFTPFVAEKILHPPKRPCAR